MVGRLLLALRSCSPSVPGSGVLLKLWSVRNTRQMSGGDNYYVKMGGLPAVKSTNKVRCPCKLADLGYEDDPEFAQASTTRRLWDR